MDTRAGVILRPSAGWSPEHVNITTALDLYGHLYPDGMNRYSDRLDVADDEASATRIGPTEADMSRAIGAEVLPGKISVQGGV